MTGWSRFKCCATGCLGMAASLYAAEYYVATNGADSNPGTLSAPFETIQHGFDVAGAGDSIILRGGTYRETVSLSGKSGYNGAPITFAAYPGEEPVLSGLDVFNLSWSATGTQGLYAAVYTGAAFDQLFFNGEPMLEARWPNVPQDAAGEWDFFSSNVWAAVDSNGCSYGTIRDADLGTNTWDATGSRIVLNVDHQYYCWSRTVTSHAAGSDTLHYPQDLDGISAFPTSDFIDDRYYLVGRLAYLDAPGEWAFEAGSGLLYFRPPTGMDTGSGTVEIKVRDYSLVGDQDSDYITVDGITFWGTAFSFGADKTHKASHIVFRNNTVEHSSWTEYFRMPGSDPNRDRDRVCPTIHADQCQVVDNVFAYGALSALFINGFDNVVENNEFHDFDYNSSLTQPPLEVGRGWSSYVGTGGRAVVRWNTMYNSGGIHLRVSLEDNDVYLNDLSDMFLSCWGGNKDHSALYSGVLSLNRDTRFHHNWIHDGYAGTPPLPWAGGMGIRGDDGTVGLTVDHNVAWNLGSTGILVKNPENPATSNANFVLNNTVFNHSAYNSTEAAMIVVTDSGQNRYSIVNNNMAETVYGGWYQAPLGTLLEFGSNSTGTAVESLLPGIDWFDFRPASGSAGIIDGGIAVSGITDGYVGAAPDVGAYEAGDSVYWIPGRRGVKAGFPIVPDGAVVPPGRDVLMWRPAYNAASHRFYFGLSPEELGFQGEFIGETNVCTLPALSSGTAYYWRVDAVAFDGSVVAGDVWSFTTEALSNSPPAFVYNPFSEPDADQGEAYDRWLGWVVSDPEDDPVGFAKVSGPSWLNVAINGNITGTPAAADVGTNSFTVSASDGINPPVEAAMDIIVH